MTVKEIARQNSTYLVINVNIVALIIQNDKNLPYRMAWASGNNHTIILARFSSVGSITTDSLACGSNFYGQIGLGDTINKNAFTTV